MKHIVASLSVSLVLSAAALAQPSVTLGLSSPQNGQTVAAGATVAWTISGTVSAGDNFGLALVAVDLTQDAGNPAIFILPYADASSYAANPMLNFSRPAGISNPGEAGLPSGFVGSHGGANSPNLLQIGGAQNTFGQAGVGIGTSTAVINGVGQSGAQVIATGSFAAPATEGTYTFRLSNGIANVLATAGLVNGYRPVEAAMVNTTGAAITITVGTAQPQVCPGDSNGDTLVNFADISPFIAAIKAGNAGNWTCNLAAGFGPYLNSDANGDGVVNFADISPFIALLKAPPAPCVSTCP